MTQIGPQPKAAAYSLLGSLIALRALFATLRVEKQKRPVCSERRQICTEKHVGLAHIEQWARLGSAPACLASPDPGPEM